MLLFLRYYDTYTFRNEPSRLFHLFCHHASLVNLYQEPPASFSGGLISFAPCHSRAWDGLVNQPQGIDMSAPTVRGADVQSLDRMVELCGAMLCCVSFESG